MIEIILDATQLEVVESCAMKWKYDHVDSLVTVRSNRALSTGSFYHEVLKFHYSSGAKPLSDNIAKAIRFAEDLATNQEAKKKWPEVEANPKFHLDRLRSYIITNLNEDDQMEILAVEKGFSTLLYEDADRRYILEGIIDLISIERSTGLTITDHKTQSRFYDKYAYNHQALNYLSFSGANYFRYNYIGLQDKQNENTFRRPIWKPGPGVIEQWKKDIFHTFRKAENAVSSGTFPKERQACDGKFGLCQFHKLCEIPDEHPLKYAAFSHYKKKEEIWRAWG